MFHNCKFSHFNVTLRLLSCCTRVSNISYHNLLPPNFPHVNASDLLPLGFGYKFCPFPREPPRSIYEQAFSTFIRRFRIFDFFSNIAVETTSRDYDPRFKTPSLWMPPGNTEPANYICKFISNFKNVILSKRSVLKRESHLSLCLKKLRSNKFIKIVQTDKNLGLCVLSIERYHELVFDHLNDTSHYLLIGIVSGYSWQFIFPVIIQEHEKLLSEFAKRRPNKTQVFKFLCSSEKILPQFHVLPKLHKKSTNMTSRPIIGAVRWITTNWSIYLCSVLEKMTCDFVLKNSFTLIEKLEDFEVLDSDFLVTADVTSLYTLMSLSRLYSCLQEKGLPEFETNLIRFICKNNYFVYGSAVFKQLDGIAMGFNAAVHCANIYLDSLDWKFAPFCLFYGRYIDDIFMVFRGSEIQLEELFESMNCFIKDIHLNFSYSRNSVDFLDLTIFKNAGKIAFTTFQKSMNIYQYLPPFSVHSPACISGFVKGEVIRYVRTNTLLSDRLFLIELFRNRLLARGYSRKFLNRVFNSVSVYSRSLVKNDRKSVKLIPLILPYFPNIITVEVKKFVHDLNSKFMDFDSSVQFIVAFSRNPNILQLSSRSNISREQELLMTEKEENFDPGSA